MAVPGTPFSKTSNACSSVGCLRWKFVGAGARAPAAGPLPAPVSHMTAAASIDKKRFGKIRARLFFHPRRRSRSMQALNVGNKRAQILGGQLAPGRHGGARDSIPQHAAQSFIGETSRS